MRDWDTNPYAAVVSTDGKSPAPIGYCVPEAANEAGPSSSSVQMTYLGVLPSDPALTKKIRELVERQSNQTKQAKRLVAKSKRTVAKKTKKTYGSEMTQSQKQRKTTRKKTSR